LLGSILKKLRLETFNCYYSLVVKIERFINLKWLFSTNKMTIINRLKQAFGSTLTGLALLAGCEEIPEEINNIPDWTLSYEEIHECDPEETDEYFNFLMKISEKFQDRIIDQIDENIDEEYQLISPENVLDLMRSGEVDIMCGTPKEKECPEGTECYDGYYIASGAWSKDLEVVIITEPSLLSRRDEYYEPNKHFLDSNLDPDYKLAEEIMEENDSLHQGYKDVKESFEDLYISSTSPLGTLIHEFTHAAFYLNGLDSSHGNTLELDYSEDPAYGYGYGVWGVWNYFNEEVEPTLEDIKEGLED